MPDDRIKNRLDKINRHLYDRNVTPVNSRRASFSQASSDLRHDWHDEPVPKQKSKFSGLQASLLAALVFFIISLAYAAFSFQSGRNIISPDNVDITIKGPVSIKGGEEMTLQIEITNKNTVDIESVDLSVAYPEGTRSAEDLDKEVERHRNFIGTIKSGDSFKETVRAVLFGDENEEKNIVVRVEYRTAGSSAIVPVVKNYVLVITSAPVHVSLELPEETNSGKEIPIEVNVTSNSSQTINDVYLEIDLPNGFKISSSEPDAVFGKTLWSLGDLPPGISRSVKIVGEISGEENDALSFKATVGLRRDDNDRGVSIPYSSTQGTIAIKPAFVGLKIALDGSSLSEVVSRSAEDIRGQLVWVNKLPVDVRDGELTLKFTGPILNQAEVVVRDGFYRSSDNTIIWKPQDVEALDSLASGATGKAEFDFAVLDTTNITALNITNPTLDLFATFTGLRTATGFEGETILSTASTKVKLESTLRVLAQGNYVGGAFVNTGPIPPKVGQETTYTITWSVSDSYNKVNDVIVVGTLPTYVKWLDVTSDSNEKITYNEANGNITWDVGDINAYVGTKFQAREVSFRVSLIPSLSHLEDFVDLVSNTRVTGIDAFTDSRLSGSSRNVTTSNISGLSGIQGQVTQ